MYCSVHLYLEHVVLLLQVDVPVLQVGVDPLQLGEDLLILQGAATAPVQTVAAAFMRKYQSGMLVRMCRCHCQSHLLYHPPPTGLSSQLKQYLKLSQKLRSDKTIIGPTSSSEVKAGFTFLFGPEVTEEWHVRCLVSCLCQSCPSLPPYPVRRAVLPLSTSTCSLEPPHHTTQQKLLR